jgi:hypothetical protein
MNKRLPILRPAVGQRCVVMIFALIVLVIMLIGALAVVRSGTTGLALAGNLGFKRDLTNQGERALAVVLEQMQTGALADEAQRQAHLPAQNYRAQQFVGADITPQGVPRALLSEAAFGAVGTSDRDIAVPDMGVTVRYVIDRLCAAPGIAEPDSCTMADATISNAANSSTPQTAEFGTAGGQGAVPQQVVYRLSVRVTGPRNTQAFFQTTFTL